MRDYLIFRLYGPMASWGDIAIGEFRPSFSHPTKSAVLGLLAAAIGIDRNDQSSLDRVNSAYGIALLVENRGVLLSDFHTAQAPRSSSNHYLLTRKDEVTAAQEDTKAQAIISYREYYCDALSLVCLWGWDEHPPYSLAELREALNKPRFPLYLGRKSCPPSLPLCPQLFRSVSLDRAIKETKFPDTQFLQGLNRERTQGLWWETTPDQGIEPQHVSTRRDSPLNRRAWQFADREENYAQLT